MNDKINNLIERYEQIIADGEEHQTTNFNWATAERIEMAREFINELICLYQDDTSE